MMLIEQTTTPDGDLPVQDFKDHLRLGTGFAEEDVQDTLLTAYLRAAIKAVEGATGKALFERDFSWSVASWRDLSAQVLPVAPVSAISALSITDKEGAVEAIAASAYRLERDTHRPKLVSSGFFLPTIPVSGSATIEFTAGYGAAWADVPADLGRAVLILAASFYENRSGTDTAGAMPQPVRALIQPYRDVRLFRGSF